MSQAHPNNAYTNGPDELAGIGPLAQHGKENCALNDQTVQTGYQNNQTEQFPSVLNQIMMEMWST